MKVKLLLQKAIESNVKPQPVKPQHKEVKPGTFVYLLIVQQDDERQTAFSKMPGAAKPTNWLALLNWGSAAIEF